MMKRRKFLQRAAVVTGAGISDLSFTKALSQTPSYSAANKGVTFDFHCHPGAFYRKGSSSYGGDEAVAARIADMLSARLSGAFFSTVSDSPILQRTENGIVPARVFDRGEAWSEYKRQLAILKELLGVDNKVRLAMQSNDLKDDGTLSAYIACEGGDFLDGLGRLDEAYADGVRAIQLVHYAPNQLGDLQTQASVYNGLSAFGREVVVKMNQLGMVIDVAHAPFNSVKAVASISDSPIILSHSILKGDPSRPIAARAITEDHARVVAETGGVIGAWPSGFSSSFDDFVENTLRLVDVVGVDHVGLGTDMDANFRPVLDRYSQFSLWTEALGQRGLSVAEVRKLAGGNAARVLGAVLK